MKIKAKQTKVPYTEEEREKIFKEGLVRSWSNKEKNKKAYTRKQKHKLKY